MDAYQIEHLSYEALNNSEAIKNISFTLPVNSKVVLLGSCNSGKSPLLRHLNGSIIPQQGSVRILGNEINRKNRKAAAARVRLVEPVFKQPFFSANAWEYVTLQFKRGSFSKSEIIARSRMALAAVDMFYERQIPFSELNSFQKKKVSIAVALVHEPEIILFDEPISGLDPQSYSEMFSLLQALYLMGKTIVVATHDVDFAAAWGEVVVVMGDAELLAIGNSTLTIDSPLMSKAKLRVPTIAMPFIMLPGCKEIPRTLQEAMRIIWKLQNLNDKLVSSD
jgi:cobalt/nickel transport system ATP-binding protein